MKNKLLIIIIYVCLGQFHMAKAAGSDSNNQLYFRYCQCRPGENATLRIAMRSTVAISGFQFDLFLPDGVSVESKSDIRLVSERVDGGSFQLRSSYPREGSKSVVRVICYSMSDTFAGIDGDVVQITILAQSYIPEDMYDVILRASSISCLNGNTFNCTDDIVGQLFVSENLDDKIENVEADIPLEIYNVNGIQVKTVSKRKQDFIDYPRGFYIVNGKKIVIE